MSTKFSWIIALAFSLMLNQTVFADSSICKESLSKMVQSINLDQAQKAKIQPILDQLKANMKSLGSQMNGLEEQLTEQTNSPNMDQGKVNSVVDQKTKLIGDMMKSRVTATNQIYSHLNPQQKLELQNKIKKADEKIADEFKKCEQD